MIRVDEAEHDHVPGPALEQDVPPQDAFPDEAGLLQHALRRRVLHVRHGLQPAQPRPRREHLRRGRPHRARRHAAAPVVARHAVPDGRPGERAIPGGLHGDGAHGAAGDADGAVPRVRQHVVGDVPAGLVQARVGVAALEAGHARVGRPRHERLRVGLRQRELAEGDLRLRLRRRRRACHGQLKGPASRLLIEARAASRPSRAFLVPFPWSSRRT
jgi:hypothetical protein